jgi:hypothetical protein
MESHVDYKPTVAPADVDIPAMREKYRRECDKRIRRDSNEQLFARALAGNDKLIIYGTGAL